MGPVRGLPGCLPCSCCARSRGKDPEKKDGNPRFPENIPLGGPRMSGFRPPGARETPRGGGETPRFGPNNGPAPEASVLTKRLAGFPRNRQRASDHCSDAAVGSNFRGIWGVTSEHSRGGPTRPFPKSPHVLLVLLLWGLPPGLLDFPMLCCASSHASISKKTNKSQRSSKHIAFETKCAVVRAPGAGRVPGVKFCRFRVNNRF